MENKHKKLRRAEVKLLKLLGEKIRGLRKEKKMTQAELAAACELDKQSIFRIEKGEFNITLTTLFRLADGLGVLATDLLVKI